MGNQQDLLTFLAALSALFAVLLGPLVSLRIANQHTKLNTHSNNRQEWINTLRDSLAEYISEMVLVSGRSYSGNATEAEYLESTKSLSRIESKIELLLNPNEKDHQELAKLLEGSSRDCWRQNVDNFRELPLISSNNRKRIVALSQKILKREWERVKAGA